MVLMASLSSISAPSTLSSVQWPVVAVSRQYSAYCNGLAFGSGSEIFCFSDLFHVQTALLQSFKYRLKYPLRTTKLM